ncbi:MAG: rhodanese-like domain-containing protein [Bacteroidia bacterium]
MKLKLFYLPLIAVLLMNLNACSQNNNKQNKSVQTSVTGISELLSPADFAAKMKENPGILIDVRTPQETKKGVIPNARLLNMFDDNFENEINKLDKSQTYYVYCASGGRSSETAEMMIKKGFKHVVDLEGGYTRWVKESLPTTLPN